jgi:hypothetical protein
MRPHAITIFMEMTQSGINMFVFEMNIPAKGIYQTEYVKQPVRDDCAPAASCVFK